MNKKVVGLALAVVLGSFLGACETGAGGPGGVNPSPVESPTPVVTPSP